MSNLSKGAFEKREVTLGFPEDAPDPDPKELLHALGLEPDPELTQTLERLKEAGPELAQWMKEDPERARQFAANPVGVLTELFPHIDVPTGGLEIPIDPAITIDIATVQRVLRDEPALKLLRRIWEHIAENEANLQAFRRAPFEVVATVAGSDDPDVVDRVARALEVAVGDRRPWEATVVLTEVAQQLAPLSGERPSH